MLKMVLSHGIKKLSVKLTSLLLNFPLKVFINQVISLNIEQNKKKKITPRMKTKSIQKMK
jgi:hypothetical protein